MPSRVATTSHTSCSEARSGVAAAAGRLDAGSEAGIVAGRNPAPMSRAQSQVLRADASFDSAVQAIIAAGSGSMPAGSAPATSGISRCDWRGSARHHRVGTSQGAASTRGHHAGRLKPAGRSSKQRPSAETALHLLLYSLYPRVNAVLHVHSVAGVTLTRHARPPRARLKGYEMLKAFPGITPTRRGRASPSSGTHRTSRRSRTRGRKRLQTAPPVPRTSSEGTEPMPGVSTWMKPSASSRHWNICFSASSRHIRLRGSPT